MAKISEKLFVKLILERCLRETFVICFKGLKKVLK